ncbi:MAG: RHS repeat-associated core domain-containing protein [Acidobacteria bacterium]|nr:RHS repeat-associated core domain-containing protein [Acidobacteriota bacterium]
MQYVYQAGGADDPLNRLQRINYDLSGPRDTSIPIGWTPPSNFTYMATGDKTRVQMIDTEYMVNQTYAYDVEGRVSEFTQKIKYRENYPMTMSYLYDSLDRVMEVKYPERWNNGGGRKIVAHTYDSASRLSTLTYDGSQHAGNIIYNASGQTTQVKVGTAGANQVTEDYTFDAQTGLLTNQQAKLASAANPFIDLSYDYARNNSVGSLNGKTGHLTKITDNLNNAKNREYEFDVLGRLTKAKGGPTGNLWDQTYSYDRWGNRLNVAVRAGSVAADGSPMPSDGIPNLSFDNTSNRITTAGFQYDVNGNMIRSLAEDGVTWVKYEYDAANRLNIIRRDSDQVQLERFQYDHTNARVQSHDPATNQYKTYVSAGGTTLAEFTETTINVPVWTKSYTYLGGSQLATITRNGQNEHVEYNHPDRLGTKAKTNQSGGTSTEQAHLPFGRPLDAETSPPMAGDNKRFTSYDRSAFTKLDYAVNRTYDSKLGRFTQVDPIGMQAASLAAPQTLNLYSYCGNDPINNTDPSGLFWGFLKKPFKWIMVAVAVIVAIVTIVGVFSVPFTIAELLGAISAGSGAIAGVAGALGYNNVARIFGLIAVATGFGSLIAAHISAPDFSSYMSLKELGRALEIDGAIQIARTAAWQGIFTGVGAIANGLSGDDKKKRSEMTDADKLKLAIQNALARLTGECLDYIRGNDIAKDPDAIGRTIPIVHDQAVIAAQGQGVVAASTAGKGMQGKVWVGDEFFGDLPGLNKTGFKWPLPSQRRQAVLLDELRHLTIGNGHPKTGRDSYQDVLENISKKCF